MGMFASVYHDLKTDKKWIYVKKREYERAIGIQVTLTLEIKYGNFLTRYCVLFEPMLEDGDVHMYATTKELKIKTFTVKR